MHVEAVLLRRTAERLGNLALRLIEVVTARFDSLLIDQGVLKKGDGHSECAEGQILVLLAEGD